MIKKDVYSILSLILFLLGVLFILNLNADITGATIGITLGYMQNAFIGIVFLVISTILFIHEKLKLEEIKLISRIHEDKTLERLAEEATKNQKVQRDLDHLIYELKKGNLNAGLPKKSFYGITELRTKEGARLYIKKINGGYEILAKSAKGINQDKVIERIKKLYS